MTLTEPRRHAVIIGSAHYDDDNLSDYATIENSAVSLAAIFEASELWHSCVPVHDPEAAAGVMLPIREAARKCQPGDTLLVYFIGHAISPRREQHNDILLALRTTLEGEYWSYLSLFHVYDMMRLSRATSKILVLDCCYCGSAGTLGSGPSGAGGDLTDPNWLTEGTSTCVLKAVGRSDLSQKVDSLMEQDPGSLYTAFSGHLISILENGIAGTRSPLRVRDVYNELRRTLPASGRHPEPELLIRNEPRIVLLENRSAAAIQGAPGDPAQLARLRAATPEELADAWMGEEATLAGLPRALVDEYFTATAPRADGESLRRMVHHLHVQGAANRLDELLSLTREAAPEIAGAMVRELRRGGCRSCAGFAVRVNTSTIKTLTGVSLHRYAKAASGD
jgi:hypothetical protein